VTIAGLIQQGYEVQMIALGRSAPGDPTVESEISRLGVLPQFCSDFATPREGGWRTPANAVFAADLSAVPRWISNRLVPLATAIERYRPAVVHTWLDGPAVVGGLAACALGVPRLVIAQGSLSIRHRRVTPNAHMLTGYRYVARNPNVVMVNNSAAGAADYEHWLGMSGGTIRVLYNGFRPDTVRIPSQTEIGDFRASLGLSAETPVVGTLMRLVEEKDPDLWVDTAAEIAKARPDVRFLIIGYGPLREQILQRAQNAGIGDRTIVKDAMTDVGLGYAVIDVILLTSSVEGVSNTLLEAQAAGRSVVATDVGGMREAVAHGLTGLIVPERSPQRLAGAVLKILNDPTFQTRGSAEGPKFVANRFGLNRMIRETIEAYGRP
jgi:glycosyltransferase involved in cell wall biosynthesis